MVIEVDSERLNEIIQELVKEIKSPLCCFEDSTVTIGKGKRFEIQLKVTKSGDDFIVTDGCDNEVYNCVNNL